MTIVWLTLGFIFGYELVALITGRPTWSVIIRSALQGHPVKATIIFGVVVLIAAHVIFGLWNRHRHSPQPVANPDAIVDGF